MITLHFSFFFFFFFFFLSSTLLVPQIIVDFLCVCVCIYRKYETTPSVLVFVIDQRETKVAAKHVADQQQEASVVDRCPSKKRVDANSRAASP